MSEREPRPGEDVDEEEVVEVEEATEPLTEEDVRQAQAEDAESGEAVVGVEEATDPLTPEEVREAQAEDQVQEEDEDQREGWESG
jgi:hypothetical protein